MSMWRAGFVGLVGLPNAGKSTLLNQLVGQKISVVTAKPQTTRRRVHGLLSENQVQAIFVDAPGMIHAERGLNRFLESEFQSVVEESDVLVAVLALDTEDRRPLDAIMDRIRQTKKPWVAYLAKTDLGFESRLNQLTAALTMENVPVIAGHDALPGDQLAKIFLETLAPLLPKSKQPLFNPQTLTTESVRDLAAELIRESAFNNLHQEVPYQLAVQILRYEELPKLHRIFAEIVVARDNHRKIVVGKNGQTIKAIGMTARKAVEDMVGCKVYLDLNVRLKINWTDEPRALRELGYGLPQSGVQA